MQIRLTSVQRRLLSRTFLIGAMLTVAVVVVERIGVLTPLERFLYDNRAYHFQRFKPPPSKDIVHVSIDDQSTNEIGRWPWPRATIALIIEELREAGAKVIALDIIMPEAQDTRYQQDGAAIEDDRVLAKALQKAGNVLVPAAAGEWRGLDVKPIYLDAVEILEQDLEQSPEDVERKLVEKKYPPVQAAATARGDFLEVSRQATFQRMRREMHAGVTAADELKNRLAPKAAARGQRSDATITAEKVWGQLDAFERLRRFTQPPPGAPPLLKSKPHTTQPPVPALCDAAAFSGYVEFLQFDDGIVRSVPLIADVGGRALPHMALATACAALGVPFADVRIESDRITIPRPADRGGDIVIPVRTIPSDTYGRVGCFLDLSWFGVRDPWWSMYDHPDYKRPVQQDSLKNVWRVEELRRSIRRNEELALEDLLIINSPTGIMEEKELRDRWASSDSAARLTVLAEFRDHETVKQFMDILKDSKPEELNPEDKLFLAARSRMEAIVENNKFLNQRIDETRAQLRQKFQDKILMVGWTAAGQYDYYPTSLHAQCPGVVIQGVAVNSILTQHFWRFAPAWLAPFITMGMGGAVTFLTAVFPSYRALVATVLLAAAYYFFNAVVLFDYGDRIVPLAGAMTSAGLVWGILTLYRYIFESAERARITQRFSSYVDPAIVNYYIEDPDRVRLDGEVREMTVVFTDLAGFTTISEKLQERTVPLLNDYMSRMMPLIRRHNGRWNKFLGDGIMFFYNAPQDDPQHARNAVQTVLEMQKAVEEFNKDLFKQQLPKVAMRAGIVTGNMVVGDSGSMDPLFYASDYTVLGDNVNLSARLESANKALGSRMLCVKRTIELMGPGIIYRPMAMLQVVGKTQGVMTYEPLCFECDATEEIRALAKLTTSVVERYIEGKFEECLCAASSLQERFGSSKFTKLYLECAREFSLAPPGDGFDGTIVLEAK